MERSSWTGLKWGGHREPRVTQPGASLVLPVLPGPEGQAVRGEWRERLKASLWWPGVNKQGVHWVVVLGEV